MKMSFQTDLKKSYFRMLVIGSTGSGKSYFVSTKILPLLKDIYDDYVIFTRKFNIPFYKEQFSKHMDDRTPTFKTDISTLLVDVKKIVEAQENNIKSYDNLGNPIYHTNIMFIFDDIIDEKLFKNDKFLEIFVNLRHLQISVILCSQIVNKAISTAIKANTNFFVFFRINSPEQLYFPINLLKGCLLKKDINMSKWSLGTKAFGIYAQKVSNVEHGYVVISDSYNIY